MDLLEEEDVFPTWARNELQSGLAEEPAGRQYPPRVVLRACATCNRGLGDEFEHPVAPIMKPLARGERATLDREQRTLVARWAWLKDIEYILGRPEVWTPDGPKPHTEKGLAFWRKELDTLRSTRRPPRGYVVRLATIGPASDTTQYLPFAPHGWGREHADPNGINSVGLLVIETFRTTRKNAAEFIEHTLHDNRVSLVWPLLKQAVTIGSRKVPLNHVDQWREDHNFYPGSGWGGGWRIPVPHES